MMLRTLAIALAVILTCAAPANARNAAGSRGAHNQGVSHHNNTVDRKLGIGRGVIDGPAPCCFTKPTPLLHAGEVDRNEGTAPRLDAILRNKAASSDSVYRAELCRIFPKHSEQIACFDRPR